MKIKKLKFISIVKKDEYLVDMYFKYVNYKKNPENFPTWSYSDWRLAKFLLNVANLSFRAAVSAAAAGLAAADACAASVGLFAVAEEAPSRSAINFA